MLSRLCDNVNTPGGHLLILLALVAIGAFGERIGLPKADDVFVGSFTALLAVLAPKVMNGKPAEAQHAAA